MVEVSVTALLEHKCVGICALLLNLLWPAARSYVATRP